MLNQTVSTISLLRDKKIGKLKVIMQGKLIAVAYVYSAYILKPVLSGRNL